MADPRMIEILKILKKTYPGAKCSLIHEGPWQLLVATILSAQCTDERQVFLKNIRAQLKWLELLFQKLKK
jgi:endonuclease III